MKKLFGIALLTLMAAQVQAASITVFTGPDFRGEQRTFDRAAPRLGDVGWDDRIASVQIRDGEWELCQGEQFMECITVSRDAPNLARWAMDYEVSSLRPLRDGSGDDRGPPSTDSPLITVFEGSDFRGQQRSFAGGIPRLRNQGWSDRIGSVKVGSGDWELCAGEDYQDCVTVSQDQSDLSFHELDYRISSLRPVEIAPPPLTSLPDRLTQEQSEFLAERLYRGLLGRDPDPEGLRNSTSKILFGNLGKLIDSLVSSSELRDTQLSPEDLLEQLYQGLLNRSPREGAQGYLTGLQQGRTTDVVLTILNSEEFLRQLPE
jgi:hypothetical protein